MDYLNCRSSSSNLDELNCVHVLSSRRRSRSASSSGSSSSGSPSPKKAMKRVSSTPPRKQGHVDASVSPSGKERRSPSPRGRRGRGSATPPRSSGTVFVISDVRKKLNFKHLSGVHLWYTRILAFKRIKTFFIGFKRKPERGDSSSDNVKARPEGSESG